MKKICFILLILFAISNVYAVDTTCSSCLDCTNKLNGDYDTVYLDTDIPETEGPCISFSANDIDFSDNLVRI